MFEIIKCDSYDEGVIKDKLDELVNLGDYISKGDKVVVKPNLLDAFTPEQAITTHPAIVKAVVEKLQEIGADVTIADSPRFRYSKKFFKRVYDTTGMSKVAEDTGCKLNYDLSFFEYDAPDVFTGKIRIMNVYKDAKIINISKVKTHGMAKVTCAVKNLYGLVPGATKMRYHFKSMDANKFGDLLIKINTDFKPVLTIVDGVIGSEGQGPDRGTPRELDILAAGTNSFEIDYNISKIIEQDPLDVEYIKRALDRNLFKENNEDFSEYKVKFKPAVIANMVRRQTK